MLRGVLGLTVAVLLGGCASVRTLDSEVQSFSTLAAVPAVPTYRFERFPSQQAQPQRQAEVEAMAEQALTRVGMRRDDAQARYTVQLGVRVQQDERIDWNEGWWVGPDLRRWNAGYWRRWPSPGLAATPWYVREVSLALRDKVSGQVVYETHAQEEGVWSDTPQLLPALFRAALRDFPAASPGAQPRKVQETLP